MPSKPRVYLIDLGTGSNLNLLPLGIGRIASYCRSLKHLADAFQIDIHYLRQEPVALAQTLDHPVVVGLAAYIWNLQATLAVARAIRAAHPGCLIVLGGASVPKRPERIQQFMAHHPYVDVLVHGEGELTFAAMLEALAVGQPMTSVAGLSARLHHEVVSTTPRPRMASLDVLPSPFLDGTFDRLMELHRSEVTGAVLESNRGCPYSCTYCDWGGADVTKITTFHLDRIKAEVDWVATNGIPYIFLADANFGILYERDLSLAQHIASCCRTFGVPRFMGITFTKNNNEKIAVIAETLQSGGIQTGVTLSAQSYHPPTLAAIKRRNLDGNKLDDLKKRFRARDILTYNELILGLPEETLESFLAGVELTMTTNLKEHWVAHLCNVLENTEMAQPEYLEKYGIATRSCGMAMSLRVHDSEALSEEEVIVVSTRAMPLSDWARAYDLCYWCAALHNFRLAYFVLTYFKVCHGIRGIDLASYLIDEIRSSLQEWPHLARCIQHLAKQRKMIMDGIARYSPVAELGNFNASPQEAIVAVFLEDEGAHYAELRRLTDRFVTGRGLPVREALLDDLFAYQSLRMTAWREPGSYRQSLSHNLVGFFEAVQADRADPELSVGKCEMEVVVPPHQTDDRHAYARMRTRGVRYTDIHDATLVP